MKTNSLLSASLISFTLAAGACAQQSELSNEDYDDVAMGVGTLVATPGGGGEAGAMSDATTVASEGQAGLIDGSGAIEIVVRAGLSYEYRADCFDAAGAEQDACGEATDRADVSVSWTGELDTARYDATVMRVGEWSISGLQSATATLTGSGSFEVDSEFQAMYRDVTRSLHLSYDAEYDSVQIDTETRQAVGGTIHYAVRGERFVQRGSAEKDVELSVDAEVTFHADGTATLVLDGSRSYSIDIATGTVVSAS
ncbi:MAG TPA: hypothetical protein VNM90_29275 [Haliangium sp.]|nr:hypothetical protein [Haliangium sp.]